MMENDNEIKALMDKYSQLEEIVDDILHKILITDKNTLIHITHRIKTMDSIKGKLKRKSDSYASIYDIRDILGFRVISYFSSDVDRAAEIIAKHFRVDMDKSKDKRELIDARSFGYLSLHYICSLPEEYGELSDLWFEIQIKTILQHSWAEIEHDLGYKAEIEVPREIRRSFSKAASLLETTDDIFSDIQRRLNEYTARVKREMANESLDELYFDRLTLTEFTAHNASYRKLLDEIAAITNANITEGVIDNILIQIDFLGINTLGDMSRLIEKEHDLALKLARESLEGSELDELSSTVAFYYLFRAMLIKGDFSKERIREFLMLTTASERSIEYNLGKIMEERSKLV